MYEFPHSNNFDSDLREIVELYLTVKDLPKTWETYKQILDTDYAELKAFVNGYFDNLDVQNEINNKIDSMVNDGTMENIIRPIFNEYNQELNVLKARMDTFTQLPDDATAGDAELADARIDYTGKTWGNVGEHIRGVTSELSSEIVELNKALIDYNKGVKFIAINKSCSDEHSEEYTIDFAIRTFVKITNMGGSEAFFSPQLFQDGVLKTGYNQLYQAGETKIIEIMNVNTDWIHGQWIPNDGYFTDYTWSIKIANSNNELFEYTIFSLTNDSPVKSNNTIIVDINNMHGSFKFINDAIAYAKNKYDVNTTPVTIFIKNGTYDLIPISSRNAVIDKGGNKISIIGESRDGVVITLTNTPASNNKIVEHGGESIIANITFKNIWYDDGTQLDTSHNAYCVHNDVGFNSRDKKYKTVLKNCYLYSEAFTPLGAGLQGNQVQVYEDCIFDFNCKEATGAYNDIGALYVHAPANSTATNCGLIIDNCTAIAQRMTRSLVLPNVEGSKPFSEIPTTIRRSIFVTNGNVNTLVNKENTLLTVDSALNNVESLNFTY